MNRSVVTSLPVDQPAHVRIVNVSKNLGTFRALDSISLNVPRGSMLTLLGPSGCGKSTTLRLLAGFYQPDEGSIFLGDEDITRLPPNKRRMTMVFQEYALFPHMTIADNVAYGLNMRRVARAQAAQKVAEMLDLVGLDGAGEKYPHQLSGGQQQRVALARSLAVDPEVLLLDEPLSNLDAKLRVRLREEIVRLQRVLGKTMVFVTHDQEEALSISDQIAVMNHGQIEQLGTPTDIYFKPATRYVAEFVGLANFIDVTMKDATTMYLGSHAISVSPQGVQGPGCAVIRPEAFSIVSGQARVDNSPVIEGAIVRRSFLGSNARYWVNTEFGELIVDEGAPSPVPHAESVKLILRADRVHVISA